MSVWKDSIVECSFGGRRSSSIVEIQSASTDKRVREIYEGKEERLTLFLAFLLQLSHREDHIDGGSSCPEPALGFGVDMHS